MSLDWNNLPSPAACRGDVAANRQATVRWEVVDPLLRELTDSGDVARLSAAIEVSRSTLWTRRQSLGLPELPRGRPPALELTKHEGDVVMALNAGETQSELATRLGVSRSAVSNTSARAAKKMRDAGLVTCGACNGRGVKICGSGCRTNANEHSSMNKRDHFHVCEKCSGLGRAEPPKPGEKCATCKGSGDYECSCNGTKHRHVCETCSGNGKH